MDVMKLLFENSLCIVKHLSDFYPIPGIPGRWLLLLVFLMLPLLFAGEEHLQRRKGRRSKTSIYPVLEVTPEIIGTGSSEDTRTTSSGTSRQNGLLPASKPACNGFPAFSRRGQNVFITCYKNIQGW